MTPKIVPLRDQVLIEREKVTQFGAILAPNQADVYRFYIRAAGPDALDQVSVGDEVDINPMMVAGSGAISPADLGADWALHSVDAVVCRVERTALELVTVK